MEIALFFRTILTRRQNPVLDSTLPPLSRPRLALDMFRGRNIQINDSATGVDWKRARRLSGGRRFEC
jgi:hypothetical protein